MPAAFRKLVLVWLTLLVLLGATVGISVLELGAFNAVLNVSIAALKALVIGVVFMHLAEEGGVVRLAAAVGFVWLLIMFGLAGTDYFAATRF